jgi:hypothetical protein
VPDVSKSLEWLKNQSPVLFLIVGSLTGALLFSPETFLQRIGFLSLVGQYRSQLGAVFLVSAVGFFVSVALTVQRSVIQALRGRKARKAREAKLRSLTSDERRYLASYLREGTRTQMFDITDGVAQGLNHDGIIYRVTSISDSNMWGLYFAYNMRSWAWEYLNANTHLLEPELSAPVEADE